MHTKEVGERFETASRYVTLSIRISQHEATNPSFFPPAVERDGEMQVRCCEPCIEQGDSPQRGAYPAAFLLDSMFWMGSLKVLLNPLKIGDISVVNGKVEGDV